MTCPHVARVALLQSSAESDPVFDDHLASCATCSAELSRIAAQALGTTFTTPLELTSGAPPDETAPLDGPERYELINVVSRGGLGIVLRARDRRLGRIVALKQMLVRNERHSKRFRREALLTARLQHPSIVPVYEAGQGANGEPFYVMKLVIGKTLTAALASALTLDARLALLPHLLAVADALAYAHGERVIHRDLKPDNILIGDFGETVVVDWGLGKRLDDGEPSLLTVEDQDARLPDERTLDGSVMGTPRFMAPEQASGAAVDERADVYALGAMIYVLISGRAPFFELDARAAIVAAREQSPTPVNQLQAGTPADLAAIVQKAMSRNPEDRYPTARELRDELRRFLTGQLVRSHDYSAWHRVRRFVAQHRAAFTAATVLIIALAVGGALAVERIERARQLAERARNDAEQRRDQLALAQARGALGEDPTAALAWLKTYPPTREWSGARAVASEALELGPARQVFRGAFGARLSTRGDRVAVTRGETLDVCALDSGACRSYPSGGGELNDAVFSLDDRTIAAVGPAGQPRIWDLASGAQHELVGIAAQTRNAILFVSPDGKTLAIVGRETVGLWRFGDPYDRVRVLDGHDGGTLAIVAFSPDSNLLAVSNMQREGVRVWDLTTGQSRLVSTTGATGAELAFSPDGKRIYLCPVASARIEEWSVVDNRRLRVFAGHKQEILSLSLSRDGTALLTGDDSGEVRVWNVTSSEGRLLGRHATNVNAVDLSSNGEWAASVGADGVIWLWNLPSGDRRELRGHGTTVEQLRFSADAKYLMSRGTERAVRIWALPTPRRQIITLPAPTKTPPAFSPDGNVLAWGADDGKIRLCDARGHACNVMSEAMPRLQALSFSRDGRLIAGGINGRVWDPTLRTAHTLWTAHVMRAYFSPDGKHVIAPGNSSLELSLFDAATGHREAVFANGAWVQGAAFSADSTRAAFSNEDGGIGWFDLADHVVHHLSIERGLQVPGVALSHDGKHLAATSEDGTIRIWDLPSETPRVLGHHDGSAQPILFSPDDRLVVSGGWDHAVRFFPVDGSAPRVGRGHRGPVETLVFSPDGRVLASGSIDGRIGLWNVASGAGRVTHAHTASVAGLAFSPDGKRLASTSDDATLQILEVSVPDDTMTPATVLGQIMDATTAELDADDHPATLSAQ